jgi:hypothetical protein
LDGGTWAQYPYASCRTFSLSLAASPLAHWAHCCSHAELTAWTTGVAQIIKAATTAEDFKESFMVGSPEWLK